MKGWLVEGWMDRVFAVSFRFVSRGCECVGSIEDLIFLFLFSFPPLLSFPFPSPHGGGNCHRL